VGILSGMAEEIQEKCCVILPKESNKNYWTLLLAIIFLTASVGSVLSILTLSFQQIFGLTRLYSVQIFTTFLALLYCSSIMGGFFGGRLTSYRYGVNLGIAFAVIGALGLYFHQTKFLIFSLSLLIIGFGLVSPCVISIFGQNLKRELSNKRSHSGFVLNYMSMNIGGVLGMSISGLWVRPSQYQNNFLFSILFLLIVGILFNCGVPRDNQKFFSFFQNFFSRIGIVIFLGILIYGVNELLYMPSLADSFLIGLTFLSVGYVLFLGKKEEKTYLRRLIFFMFLTAMTIVFFVLYNSEPDILTIFIEDHVNRKFMGLNIPASTYFMFNPFFNLIFGGGIFLALKIFKKSFSPDVWIYSSIFFMGLGFWILWLAVFFTPEGNISTGWMILVYAILSGAEMLLAPIAYEIVFIYGVPSLYGVMTGMSQLAIGLGALMTERLSSLIVPKPGLTVLESLHFFAHGFVIFAAIAFFAVLNFADGSSASVVTPAHSSNASSVPAGALKSMSVSSSDCKAVIVFVPAFCPSSSWSLTMMLSAATNAYRFA
jgi:dipeptide/tripeptide permease